MGLDSIGPVNMKKKKYGECVQCREENWIREYGAYFDSRVPMVGKVCKHRFIQPKRRTKQFRITDFYVKRRRNPDLSYWDYRAMLPSYCGEPGELTPGWTNYLLLLGRLHEWDEKEGAD